MRIGPTEEAFGFRRLRPGSDKFVGSVGGRSLSSLELLNDSSSSVSRDGSAAGISSYLKQ
jgi:hypothetical protein